MSLKIRVLNLSIDIVKDTAEREASRRHNFSCSFRKPDYVTVLLATLSHVFELI